MSIPQFHLDLDALLLVPLREVLVPFYSSTTSFLIAVLLTKNNNNQGISW